MDTSETLSESERKAKGWGIDLDLIEANLKRTYTERLEVLQQALDTVTELRRAWENDQRQRPPAAPSGKPD